MPDKLIDLNQQPQTNGPEPMGDKLIEDKPMGDKPMEDKPMGVKPMEDKPMGVKPMEDKPMGEVSKFGVFRVN